MVGSSPTLCRLEQNATAVILHTSGSTGLPKPIYLTYGFISTFADYKNMMKLGERSNMYDRLLGTGRPTFNMMPCFHMAAFIVITGIFFDPNPLILPPSDRPVSAEVVVDVLNQTQPHSGIFAPSVLEDISSTSEGLDALAQLDFLVWSGAALAQHAGDRICQRTNIATLIESTEAGLLPTLVPANSDDWRYYEWCPELGIDMELDSENLYECVIKPNPDRKYQGIFHTFPDINEWRTKDLFAKHPTRAGLWEYRGRKDDIIVLTNGEKVQPLTFEKIVEDHPLLKGALVVGQARFQTALLVEPFWDKLGDDFDPEDLLDKIWPSVEAANEHMPAHGRVWRSNGCHNGQ